MQRCYRGKGRARNNVARRCRVPTCTFQAPVKVVAIFREICKRENSRLKFQLIGAKREIGRRRCLVYDNCPPPPLPGALYTRGNFFFRPSVVVCGCWMPRGFRYHPQAAIFRPALRDEVPVRCVVSFELYLDLLWFISFIFTRGC